MRDIPSNYVEAGYKSTNMRQIVQNYLKTNNTHCRCIRCREIGHKWKEQKILPKSITLQRLEYAASGSKEIFVSLEDTTQDILLGFLRLRLCTNKIAFVRELHIFGEAVAVGESANEELQIQHRGLGKKLLAEAEELTKKSGYTILKILSGVGVKAYYNKLGYKNDGVYVSKAL